MRLLSVRLIVSLILGVTLVSLLSSYNEVRSEKRGLRQELEHNTEGLGESLAANVEPYVEKQSTRELLKIVDRFSHREHLIGVGIYNERGEPLAVSSGLPQSLSARPPAVAQAIITMALT